MRGGLFQILFGAVIFAVMLEANIIGPGKGFVTNAAGAVVGMVLSRVLGYMFGGK